MIIKDNSCGVLAIGKSLANYSPYRCPYLYSNSEFKTVLDSDVSETFISSTYVFVTSRIESLTSNNVSYDRNYNGTIALFNFINRVIKHDFNPTIIILLADELHALRMQAESTMTLDELRAMCHSKSKEYSDNLLDPHWLTRQYHLSYWGDWKRGEAGQRFQEILATLRTKISEHPIFEADLGRTVNKLFDKYLIQYKSTLSERASKAQISITKQEQLERKRVTPFFVDFALEQLAVIQLITEKVGQCNILFPREPNLLLYTLRDFWSALSNHLSTINWRPFQIFEVCSQAIERQLGGPVSLQRFVNEIGVKLILTDHTIYLSIPVEPLQQPMCIAPDYAAPLSRRLPSTQPESATTNQRYWSVYLEILAEQLGQSKIPQASKKLILNIIEIHYRTYQFFKNGVTPLYTTPHPMPLFSHYRVQATPDAHNPRYRCSSTYVFVFSIVDALLADRGYHSAERIKATVNFINDLVASDPQAKVIILLADELQALNAQAESDLTLDALRQACHNKGVAWFSGCKLYFDKIRGGYKLYHWGEWIGGLRQQRFQEIVHSYHHKLAQHPDFDRAAHQTYTPYLDNCLRKARRFLSHEEELAERTRITPFFAAYPLEETAVVQLIIETLGSINLFYPKILNPTLYYLRNFWSILTGNIPNIHWLPFQDFQVPCVARKTIISIPQPAPTTRNQEDFPFTFNRNRLFQALPLNCLTQKTPVKNTQEKADSIHKLQPGERPVLNSHPVIWLFSLGSIVKTLYDQSVSDEEKLEIVNCLQNNYHPSDDEDDGYWRSQFDK